MAFLHIPDVKIAGVAASVPRNGRRNIDYELISIEEREKIIQATGIHGIRFSPPGVCTSDLCFSSAEQLIEVLAWNKKEIDVLIFVSQTPDFILPATAPIIQNKLELAESCFAMDISLGCSGYIYGLATISSLISSGKLKKGLLLVGDTISKTCSYEDKSTYPLFGDAGSTTAIEYNPGNEGMKFHFGTNGSGYDTIMIKDGGYRNPISVESFNPFEKSEGIKHNNLQLDLDGMNVFSFGISTAPESVSSLLNHFEVKADDVDYFVFHQANLFMNEMIRKKLKIPKEKVPYSLSEFGNTSSASIPLTIVNNLRDELSNNDKSLLLCGFGVGLSWGSAFLKLDGLFIPSIIEL